jgi:hypothetical protein
VKVEGRLVVLLLALLIAPACLVLNVNPAYDGDTLTWDPDLLGAWQNVDDKSSMVIDRDEWKSYRIHYVHPIETGELTGYLTAVGNSKYLDVMPIRGQDRGSFLVPVHAVLRVKLDANRLELTPLSYDWFFDQLRSGLRTRGLQVILDQKENALVGSTTREFRDWLRRQPLDGRMFGAAAVFVKK